MAMYIYAYLVDQPPRTCMVRGSKPILALSSAIILPSSSVHSFAEQSLSRNGLHGSLNYRLTTINAYEESPRTLSGVAWLNTAPL